MMTVDNGPIFLSLTVGNAESLPLMEGEGRSFRVLGFTQNQRLAFVQILMRFSVSCVFLLVPFWLHSSQGCLHVHVSLTMT